MVLRDHPKIIFLNGAKLLLNMLNPSQDPFYQKLTLIHWIIFALAVTPTQ